MPLSKQPEEHPSPVKGEFTFDPVMMDLRISSLPVDQGWAPETAEFWLAQSMRDIYMETVAATGLDPLGEFDG